MKAKIQRFCFAAFDMTQKLIYAVLVLYGGYRIVRDLCILLGGDHE